MKVKVYPGTIQGEVFAPASKSLSQRALAAALLRPGKTILAGMGQSDDERAAFEIIKCLGAKVSTMSDGSLEVVGGFPKTLTGNVNINCGESGLALRMFTPIAALADKKIIIEGQGSLRQRPLGFSEEKFRKLNVNLKKESGWLPFVLHGPMMPKNIRIDGSLSSQFLSGLLFAFSASGTEETTICVENLKSKPYIDLTLEVMEKTGFPLPENSNYETFFFSANRDRKGLSDTCELSVEGDWSGAAFLLVAGAVAGEVQVKGLNVFSRQGDKKILEAFMESGCGLSVRSEAVITNRTKGNPFFFDATQCPDLFPPLVALAARANGLSVINGVSRLYHKESNRAESLKNVFEKLGVSLRIEGEQMIVEGGGVIQGGLVHAHGDHRIVMSCALAALNAIKPVIIDGAEAVRKSYPGFFEDFKHLGAQIEVLED